MEHNQANSEQTLKKEPENSESWKEYLTKEVNNILEQSEKHATKQENHESDQVMDLNGKSVQSSEVPDEAKSHVVFESDSVQNAKDSVEFSDARVVEEHVKDDSAKADDKADFIKQNEQNSIDAKQQSSEEKMKGNADETGQYKDRKKPKPKKGRSRKKLIEREEIDDWGNEDDYDDIDDDPYDEAMDDDMEDGEMEDFSEDADSINSWKMSEKPLDEAEDLDEDLDSKLKEQEDLQEEIKQLKGIVYFLRLSIYCALLYSLFNDFKTVALLPPFSDGFHLTTVYLFTIPNMYVPIWFFSRLASLNGQHIRVRRKATEQNI